MVMVDKPAKGLQCVNCESIYAISPINYCDNCFSPVVPLFNPKVRGEELKQLITAGPQSLFRYDLLLPTSKPADYVVGYTNLFQADGLAEFLGI